MQRRRISQLCAWSLGILLMGTTPVYAQLPSSLTQQVDIAPQRLRERQEIYSELTKADVVYLGETHDRTEDRLAQLEIIQELYSRRGKIAIAMEMFQRPYQSVLDKYLAGEIAEAELVEQSEYQQRWGFPWQSYAPIVRFAKEHKLPVLALNTPTEVTRKVARQGWESLTEADWQYIPPQAEIRTDNPQYRQMILDIYHQHQAGNHGSSANFERFFTAQVLWDETMASAIAQFLQTHPDYQVVAIAGSGHIIYGYGIPSRVARRMELINNPGKLTQRSVLLSPPANVAFPTQQPTADFIWQP